MPIALLSVYKFCTGNHRSRKAVSVWSYPYITALTPFQYGH